MTADSQLVVLDPALPVGCLQEASQRALHLGGLMSWKYGCWLDLSLSQLCTANGLSEDNQLAMSIGWSFGSSLGGCGKHDY